MKYFTFNEVVCSIFAFALFGAFCGFLYRTYKIGISATGYLCTSLKKVFIPLKLLIYSLKEKRVDLIEDSRNKSRNEIWDFLFFFAFGIQYITVSYVFVDGLFRLYTAALYIASFAAVYKISVRADALLRRAVYTLLNICTVLFNIIFSPFRLICGFIKKVGKIIQLFLKNIAYTVKKQIKNVHIVKKSRKNMKNIEKKW